MLLSKIKPRPNPMAMGLAALLLLHLMLAVQLGATEAQTQLAGYEDQGQRRAIRFEDYWAHKLRQMQFLNKGASREETLNNARDILQQVAYLEILGERARARKADCEPEFQARLARESDRLLVTALQQSIESGVTTPTQAELQQYYDTHLGQFSRPERYTIRFVACMVDDPNDAEQKKIARTQAEDALRRLRGGEAFADVSNAYNKMPDGYHGQEVDVTANDVSPAVIQALSALPDGGYGEVLASGSGYLVVQRVRHQPAQLKRLEEARGQIEAILQQQTRQQKWNNFQREQMAQLQSTINAKALAQAEITSDTAIFKFADVTLNYGEIEPGLKLLAREKGQTLTSGTRQVLLDALLSEKVLVYVARRQGLDQDATLRAKQERLARTLLAEQENAARIEELKAKIKVSEQERRDYFRENQERMKTERETRIRLIRIDNAATAAPPESLDYKKGQSDALQKATAVRARIRKGEAFEALMQEINGQDKDWQGESDFMTYGPRGRLVDQAVEKLKPGEMSDPVEIRGGFYLIKLVEAREPRPMSFAEADGIIQQILEGTKLQQAIKDDREQMLRAHGFEIDEQALEGALENL